MSDDKARRVTLRFDESGNLSFARGRLIFENGQAFAIADVGAIGSLPANAKLPLDASLLEELKDVSPDFQTFLYRGTIVLPR